RLLGFLRDMEFATLTKRIAEAVGAAAPPPASRPPAARPDRSAEAVARKPSAPGAWTPSAKVAAAQQIAKGKIERSHYQTRTDLPPPRRLDRGGTRRRPLCL